MWWHGRPPAGAPHRRSRHPCHSAQRRLGPDVRAWADTRFVDVDLIDWDNVAGVFSDCQCSLATVDTYVRVHEAWQDNAATH